MSPLPAELMIETNKLLPGMFVFLDLGWMDHPFPLNRFLITSADQIAQIQSLGLTHVKVMTARSQPGVFDAPAPALVTPSATAVPPPVADRVSSSERSTRAGASAERRHALERQAQSLARCERLFSEASATWRQISGNALRDPAQAMSRSVQMIDGFLNELSSSQETSIRLLSEISGDGNALHALNVTVVSLLLGRAMKLDETTMIDIGVGALLHDIGKQSLPDRVRIRSNTFTAVEERIYREHVSLGLQIAQKMGATAEVQAVLAQHHETADGKGYPKGLPGSGMSQAAKVVTLVNAYDNLCNPGNPASASTPHEAVSLMFAQLKPRFDPACLTAFIRLMGVYPPGSVVQLSDERFALVVSVNPDRPLKPTVLLFDPKVPRDEALLLDLHVEPALSIRRSLHPRNLTRAVLDYLSPRKRMSYFFERGTDVGEAQGGTAWVFDTGSGTGAVAS